MTDVQQKPEKSNLPRKEMRRIFWRSFSLLGSFNFERMQGLGFLYAVLPSLKRIYKNDDDGLKKAMSRHIETFNMTVAPSPLVMGTTVAMEERVKSDSTFDPTAISSIKVSLMGPLSGIGDTFFWGIFRILAVSLAIGFAQHGSILGPIVLLVVFNIPNFLTRWYGLKFGYRQGQEIMRSMGNAHTMQLFTYCAGIVGAMAMGSMIAFWVPITSPLHFTISKNKIVIQDYLDQIFPALLPIAFTLGVLWVIKKRIPVMAVIGIIIASGFLLGALGIITNGSE
ncbi:PTS system mannose/fructose/sorbose family transporter subunit IID [Streptomyces sp. enrichment culture]|uniref:PTS system mannose/fructose/sorbose family transporter subunit IID n=1 Tax=Streptomyces sp. enrichment culture TaxID=1795815 RepID=UPI003F548324